MFEAFSSPEFESKYTYTGNDLGAVWSPDQTVFKLWAPTANQAKVKLYRSGNPDANDLLAELSMEPSVNGTWVLRKAGNLNGIYYTFQVQIGDYTTEACDP